MKIRSAARWLPGVLLVSAALVAPSHAAQAAPVGCQAPVPSTTKPGYTVADPNCDPDGTPFQPLTDADGNPVSKTYTGIENGAAFRMEVPLDWNGELVVYAHGYRGRGTTVHVESPPLREHFVARGFAWAASSYQTNGYDVGQGVRDSHALIAQFARVHGTAAHTVYLTGGSMGGHVTATAIEQFRGSFVGAMPYCGVLDGVKLFDYFLDATVTAAALARVPLEFPLEPSADFPTTFRATVDDIKAALGVDIGRPPNLTPAGRKWSDAVERRSGGERPGFESTFAFWNAIRGLTPYTDLPFLFALYPGLDGGTAGIADGNLTSNRSTWYELDDHVLPSVDEIKLNLTALRVDRTAQPSSDLSGMPRVDGDPRIPVLSLHNIGDLFVPFSMEQAYATAVASHGQSQLFVSRAIRANGHCDFTEAELARGFDDLVNWVRTGHRPTGDAILDRRVVARDDFGCRFTVGVRADFVAPACP
ncbi:S9 family peptidase [Micromonospora sp. HM5-17]|uniref:alpha/beta hydrolase family protein n=1 Tax=Micromonospora sp. HM5-17 TaxID=2487710 RepID=UPI000F482A3B|nr:phthalyl amidase [Micromonospora sp. HM5-17]ROT32035.1 phthalyl amidase [Micromonospora sp. HM5-17]